MKRVIKASNASEIKSSFPVNHGNQRYWCHMTEYEDSPWFTCQLSKVAPYDDADYVWAKVPGNHQVQFIKDGKVIDKMQMAAYEEEDWESYDEYIDDFLDSIVVELINMNKDIKPVMVHN